MAPTVKLRWFFPALFIVVAAGWSFGPATAGGWLWDDTTEIVANPLLRDPAGLGKIWIAPGTLDYFPLKSTLQWVEWHAWRLNPAGYHLTNLCLHLLGAFLFWRLLARLGVAMAWAGAAIFALHPLVTESVAWISEFKNTLSLPPLLLAMGAYMEYDRIRETDQDGPRRARRYYILSLLWFTAAMLCKSSVVMFPVVLLLFSWWRRGRLRWSESRGTAPFFAVSLIFGLVTVWFQLGLAAVRLDRGVAIAGMTVPLGGFLSRLMAAGVALEFYLAKSVIPLRLMPIYPHWSSDSLSWLRFLPWAAAAAILAWFWFRRRTWGRHLIFGAGFFAANLIPVLGFIPMAYLSSSSAADHFAYLPLLGLAGLFAAGIGELSGCRLRVLGVVALSLVLAGLTRHHARIFRSEESFWRFAVRENPGAWLAHANLGAALDRAGRRAAAIDEYEAALQLKPDLPDAHYNLAIALAKSGRTAEAMDQFRAALRLKPAYPEAHNNLGVALANSGRRDEAIVQFQRALELRPDYPEAARNLIRLQQAQKDSAP